MNRIFAFSFSLLLVACSGGGGSGSGGTGGGGGSTLDAHIVNNTAGGAQGRLYGRLSALALEDDQGGMTANLVAGANPEFVLNDPVGEAFGLKLLDFGPGRFVAVHMSFVPGSVKFKEGTGTPVDVTIVGGTIEAPFAVPLDVRASGAYRIELRHASKVVIDKDANGKLSWRPDMVAEASGSTLLQDAQVEIMSVDVAKATAFGIIRSMTGLETTLSFLSNAILVIDGDEKNVAEFLAALKPKDVVRVFGMLDGASNTLVAFAERVDPLDTNPGNGRKNKVRGTITSVASNGARIEVRLFEIRIGGRDIPKNQPVTLGVDSSSAKIKYVPRYGRHGGHLGPESLGMDMYVEIEWHGAAPKLGVRAHKINIRSDGRFAFLQRLQGVVQSVDVTANTITLRKADHSEYVFGNERYTELTIQFASDTILVADTSGVASELKLAAVGVDDSVSVLGRKQSGAQIAAVLVVVLRPGD